MLPDRASIRIAEPGRADKAGSAEQSNEKIEAVQKARNPCAGQVHNAERFPDGDQ